MDGKLLRRPWFFGLAYGFVLLVFAFFAAGGGHGTYLLLGWFSSPLPVLGIFGTPVGISASLLGLIPLWFVMGCLLMFVNHSTPRMIFLAIICLHYLAIPGILHSEFNDLNDYEVKRLWNFFMTMIFTLGFTIYLIGQIWIWIVFFLHQRKDADFIAKHRSSKSIEQRGDIESGRGCDGARG